MLQQHGDATQNDDLGTEVTHALQRAIKQQIEADNTLTPHYTVHFTMQPNTFTHAFQSTTFTVCEFEDGSEHLETYLQALAVKLNSNEEFSPDDMFNLETTFIHTPGPGCGHSKRYKPSATAVRGITKRSRVTIKNNDLCCARAIVTMKAYVDAGNDPRDPHYRNIKQGRPVQQREAQALHRAAGAYVDAGNDPRDPHYRNIKQGRPVQQREAQALHRAAGVPEGPCRIRELQQFQAALPSYQLKVVSNDPPHMVIYAGPTPSDKII